MKIKENEIKFFLPDNIKEEKANNFTKLEGKVTVINLTDSDLIIRVI